MFKETRVGCRRKSRRSPEYAPRRRTRLPFRPTTHTRCPLPPCPPAMPRRHRTAGIPPRQKLDAASASDRPVSTRSPPALRNAAVVRLTQPHATSTRATVSRLKVRLPPSRPPPWRHCQELRTLRDRSNGRSPRPTAAESSGKTRADSARRPGRLNLRPTERMTCVERDEPYIRNAELHGRSLRWERRVRRSLFPRQRGRMGQP